MTELNVNPTRMELKKLKARLTTARRGHKLLKDKRDEMVRQLAESTKDAGELRKKVENELARVYAGFSVASASMSPKMLEEALTLPSNAGELFVKYRTVMNISVPQYGYERESGAPKMTFGYAFTSAELDQAVIGMSEIIPKMIMLAEREKLLQMLSDEIEKTRRRVNALEYIMIPRYEAGIRRITMKLEENERENIARLMKLN